MKRQIRYFCQ